MQFFIESAERGADYVAVMQFTSESILVTQLLPEPVYPVDIRMPELRRVRSQCEELRVSTWRGYFHIQRRAPPPTVPKLDQTAEPAQSVRPAWTRWSPPGRIATAVPPAPEPNWRSCPAPQ